MEEDEDEVAMKRKQISSGVARVFPVGGGGALDYHRGH